MFAKLKIALPAKVDLRPLCSPVEDQGDLGSCTGNALVGAMEVLEHIEKQTFVDLSRLFVYYNERALEGTINQDSGAQIRDGVKTLANQGVCTEILWPYVIARFKTKPTAKCFTDGLTRKVAVYSRLNTTADMRNCLAAGFPFVFGFSVYDSFESAAVATTGIVNLPAKGEKLLGGHAVLAVGYDDAAQRFIVRNSWGAAWGQKGYFTIPYAYLANRNLSDDFWTIRK
jgi:C1A family cysteine protease